MDGCLLTYLLHCIPTTMWLYLYLLSFFALTVSERLGWDDDALRCAAEIKPRKKRERKGKKESRILQYTCTKSAAAKLTKGWGKLKKYFGRGKKERNPVVEIKLLLLPFGVSYDVFK